MFNVLFVYCIITVGTAAIMHGTAAIMMDGALGSGEIISWEFSRTRVLK